MTVVPQQFRLHCVSIGNDLYTIRLYINNKRIYSEQCGNGHCIRQLLHSSNKTYDNTVNITWDTDKISSGSFGPGRKSVNNINGDQIYKCKIQNNTDRIHTLKVKGITLFLTVHIIMI